MPTIGQAIGIGTRMLQNTPGRLASRTSFWWAAAKEAEFLSQEMSWSGLKTMAGQAPFRALGGAMGRPALIGMGVGAGLNLAQNTYGNVRSGRPFYSGMMGSTFRGALGGAALGGLYGAGGFFGRSMNPAWQAFRKETRGMGFAGRWKTGGGTPGIKRVT